MNRWPTHAAIALVRLYQATLAAVLGGRCRFYPSCSAYAIDALREWGVLRGGWLAVKRLARCHPLGGHGVDPVPLRPDRDPPARPDRPVSG